MNINKQILIITYYWPPSGGAGVQRWLKFCRHLPAMSVSPYILTVDPDFAQYPAIDHSLLDEVDPGIKVYKSRARNYFRAYSASGNSAKTCKNSLRNKLARFIRGNFFIPDPRKGWNKYAYSKAIGIIGSQNITSIITSGPPHSTHLIGRKLKKKYPGLNWIADFRDPWTDIYYYNYFYSSALARNIDRKMELSVLRRADKVLTIGSGMKKLLEARIPGMEEKVHIIPNGYDENDFSGINSEKKTPGTLISYVGGISELYPLEPFLSAINQLYDEDKDCDIRLRFVGKQSLWVHEQIDKYRLLEKSEFIEYANHSEAVKQVCSSDLLLLLIPYHKLNRVIITGKVFEYIRSGNRVLGIGPAEGDAALILDETSSGEMFDPGDIEGIKSFIKNNQVPLSENTISNSVLRFERKNLTALLIDLI